MAIQNWLGAGMKTIADPTGSCDGWNFRAVQDITGRVETIADGSVLVVAWPAAEQRPMPARLLFVPPEWI